MTRQAWLNKRKTYIGGSDLSVILGTNPYKTPIELYKEKTSKAAIVEDTKSDAAYWGTVLEQIIAEEYARRTGYYIKKAGSTYYCDDYSYIACNLDFLAFGKKEDSENFYKGSHILECKTASIYKKEEWGEEGTDQIPQNYLYQVAYYCAITGYERVDIAVLIGGQDFRIYRYNKTPKLENELIEVAKKFWNEHVKIKQAPEPIKIQDVNLLYPGKKETSIIANDIIVNSLEKLRKIKELKKVTQDKINKYELEIKNFMQDNELLVDTNDNCYVSWKVLTGYNVVDTTLLKEKYPDIYDECLTKRQLFRRFVIKK